MGRHWFFHQLTSSSNRGRKVPEKGLKTAGPVLREQHVSAPITVFRTNFLVESGQESARNGPENGRDRFCGNNMLRPITVSAPTSSLNRGRKVPRNGPKKAGPVLRATCFTTCYRFPHQLSRGIGAGKGPERGLNGPHKLPRETMDKGTALAWFVWFVH